MRLVSDNIQLRSVYIRDIYDDTIRFELGVSVIEFSDEIATNLVDKLKDMRAVDNEEADKILFNRSDDEIEELEVDDHLDEDLEERED